MEDLFFNVDELEAMSRSDIQALCKKFGIRANLKTDKMKERLRKYHEEHLNGAKESREDEEKSEADESSQIEPSSVSESVYESAVESEVETMDIVPEQKEEESAVEERKEETSAVESDPASEAEEQKFEERSESESKMEIESTVTEAPIEAKQTLVPKIDFPPFEAKTETDPNVPILLPYSEIPSTTKAPMTPRSKKRADGVRKNHEQKSKNRKIAVLGEKRKALEMVVDKISVIKRTTKPTELPKIDDSIDTPKKKPSLTWSEIEAASQASDIPLGEEDIDKFVERKKERIQQQLLLSKAPSMLQRGKPIPETFDEFVSHLVKPKEEVRLAPGQTGFEFNPKVEKVVPSTPGGTTRGVQSKFGFSAVKTSFTSAASAAVNNAKVTNTAKPAIKTQSKTGVTKTTTTTKTSTAGNGDYVLGTKNLSNLKEAGSATQAKPRASIATASSRVASTVTKPVVAQSKIDSRRSLLPSTATSAATKTVTKPIASRPSMVTKPVSRQSLVPSRPSTVTKPTTAVSKTASALPTKSNIVRPITAASLKQQAAAKAAKAENKQVETQTQTEATSESKVSEAPKVEAKTDAPKGASTTKVAPRQSLIPKPTTTVTKTAASTSVTKPSTITATKPAITKPAPTTAAKAPLAAAKSTTKPSIATLIKKRKLEDASASGPAAKKQKVVGNENIENMQNAAISAPVGVSF
eukprot:TRINITY_DN2706_c0_g1_i1.p1 TRINITY_DN2706_c0_g1~~TRINITY_DN2706_c0_g1_i1.p1  ORF type:complete len:709 (-),score=172.22 TRINITY_DN2706_c0_g1_i1:22-2112(-)